jgi:transcriptional regulator of heat shock response
MSLSAASSGPSLAPGLDDRGAAILRELVELYVATGEPVAT